jgi:serine/threonine-protein kinase
MLGRVFLGRYETVQLLGEGGMGRVYLARQADLGRHVVVKVMHDHVAADAAFRDRFVRETLLMARFQHPYAVTLYDASLNDPQGPCIVMEYIKGVTLDALLQSNGRLTPQRVGRLLRQLCEVLQAAHTASIVHRDLKPANLMIVDPDTPYELLKVMDFGLAKLVSPEAGHPGKVTNAEFAVGTPGYMCPEQARGDEMDHRGDLYSVGVVLYEVLAGRLPFAGKSTMDVLLAHATEEPPPFAFVGAGGWVSPAIEEVVQSCLAKDPADRPKNARELAERYEAALAADAASTAPRAPSTAARLPTRAGLPGKQRLPAPPRPSRANGQPQSARVLPVRHLPAAASVDPLAVVHKIDAWMPERIAACKLHGFIQDTGGDVLESVPGCIRVRLGGRGSPYLTPRRNGFSWLGLGRGSGQFDVEIHLQRPAGGRENQLTVTVVVHSPTEELSADLAWRDVCGRIFRDLRAYLMGQSGVSADRVV